MKINPDKDAIAVFRACATSEEVARAIYYFSRLLSNLLILAEDGAGNGQEAISEVIDALKKTTLDRHRDFQNFKKDKAGALH